MVDFAKIAKDNYVVYVNGVRITDVPLSREELCEKLCELDLSESDILFIENMYKGGDD